MPVDVPVNVVQQLHLAVELVANLDAQLALPPDALAQSVKLVVLVLQYLCVVRVDLRVVEPILVWRCCRLVRIVSVRKQRGPVAAFDIVSLILALIGRALVTEPYRLGADVAAGCFPVGWPLGE